MTYEAADRGVPARPYTQSMLKFGKSRRTQTLLDQALVSGSNFVTGIILVRGLGLNAFGKFTVAYAILMLANGIQLSFISSTMITLGSLHTSDTERRTFVRGMFGVQLIFSGLTFVLLLAASVLYSRLDPVAAPLALVPAFTLAVVAFLLQDWLRRYYFTVGKAGSSVWNDTVSYIGQLAVLGVLMWTRSLTIATALWAIAITSGLAFALGVWIERLGCTRAEMRNSWRHSQGNSIDLGVANQLQWLVYQGAMLVGAGVAGPQAAGGVRATQNAIGPVNVAFQAMDNLVPIRAAEEMRRGGIRKASAFLFRFGAKGFLLLLVIFSAGALVSDRFLVFFYGRQLHQYAAVLNLQMVYFLLAWPVRQFMFLFRTIKNTRPILMASIVAAAASMALVYPMVHRFGAMGIVIAADAGQLGNLLYLGVAWMRESNRHRDLVDVRPV